MTKVVLTSLSILLGLFFIFLGIVKVTTFISKDLHKDMRKEFVKYARSFPLCSLIGFKVPAKWYRRIYGGLEIICGICLAFIPSAQLKKGVNGILFLMCCLNVYNHLIIDEKFERTAPALVFLFMISCRMVVEYQQEKKEAALAAAAAKLAAEKMD